MPSSFLGELLLIITAAFIGGFIARSLKFPPVLGYIVSGVIFGALGRNIFHSYASLVDFSQIGVSLLLFTLGFEISLDSIKKTSKRILLVGVAQVLLTTLIFIPLFLATGENIQVSLLFSIIFSFSSTAVVMKLLEEKGMLSNFPGNNILIILLVQDMFVIPTIFFVPLLFSHNAVDTGQLLQFLAFSVKPLIIFVLILLFSKLFLSRVLSLVFRYPSHELTILATIFIAAVSIGALETAGLPQSIAAFLAGVLISEQGKNMAPLSEIRPFRDVLLVMFFVTTGMLLNFNYFLSHIPLLLIVSLIVVGLKMFITYVILRFSHFSPSSSVFISSYISNTGEFAPIIGQIAFLGAFIKPDQYYFLLSVFILSLLYIPFFTGNLRKITERLSKTGLLKKFINEESGYYKGFAEENLVDHVVICGHGRVGKQVRSLLDVAHIPYVVIDFNRKIIDELTGIKKFAIYGDPTDDDVLKSGFIKNARVLVVAVPDSFSQKRVIKSAIKLNPKLSVICRSHIEDDRYDLINMGVNSIIIPELEAGLRIGGEVLERFGISGEEINLQIRRVRRNHLA
ncbi:MAG: hypothetical protein COX79_05055 [Candidatus Levybacteria bacterium CG_4_10_14_0_2_um_filter_36_16]|nr:MAG: hypothetical protein AUK12_04175 [Candidatus Levybacteria bacterium CG2_30_37_29]PIR78782.1 MAG: hypothetical protein COU26_04755 [Candidatus Levybacteria bacterium CG10_big_fil_rev_8_21_14_0_10_36_30]PIZ96498.1 MAG: hypothetical protein COX79_05055 [Candidatus Levybacteria bacterium CG_4_10_14_0_2_um_filter_36_16]PJA90780.1 MAG: hypothetical protein CO136_00615 [Candidatus Levybacteria bacterium CG_4_9_14_3_um_filter_36_7]